MIPADECRKPRHFVYRKPCLRLIEYGELAVDDAPDPVKELKDGQSPYKVSVRPYFICVVLCTWPLRGGLDRRKERSAGLEYPAEGADGRQSGAI